MDKNYKIEPTGEGRFKVLEIGVLVEGQSFDGWDDTYEDVVVFEGSILECEAWLRLKDKGYVK